LRCFCAFDFFNFVPEFGAIFEAHQISTLAVALIDADDTSVAAAIGDPRAPVHANAHSSGEWHRLTIVSRKHLSSAFV